jgi:hypothetical protein
MPFSFLSYNNILFYNKQFCLYEDNSTVLTHTIMTFIFMVIKVFVLGFSFYLLDLPVLHFPVLAECDAIFIVTVPRVVTCFHIFAVL